MTYTRTGFGFTVFFALVGVLLLAQPQTTSAQRPLDAPRAEDRPRDIARPVDQLRTTEIRTTDNETGTTSVRATIKEERERFRDRALEELRTLRDERTDIQADRKDATATQRAETRAELDTATTPRLPTSCCC